MLVLFGIALGVALNKIKTLVERVNDLEEFIGQTFFDEDSE